MATKMIVFVFLSTFILQTCCDNSEQVPKSGPFRAVLVSIDECRSSPSRPYMKDPPIIIQMFVHNVHNSSSMLSGNFTVLRETKNVKRKIKSFLWRNGKWQADFLLNNLDCHGLMIHIFCVATKINYDRKNCVFRKGSYTFKNLDINHTQHYLVSTMDYGLQRWRIEEYTPAGTLICKEFDMIIKPV